MGTPLRSNYTAPADSSPVWLDSERFRMVTGGVTIDSAQVPLVNAKRVLLSGTVIVKQANGKWAPAPSDAATIAGRYLALVWETVDVTNGDEATGAMDAGRVITARLPAAISTDQYAALRDIVAR